MVFSLVANFKLWTKVLSSAKNLLSGQMDGALDWISFDLKLNMQLNTSFWFKYGQIRIITSYSYFQMKLLQDYRKTEYCHTLRKNFIFQSIFSCIYWILLLVLTQHNKFEKNQFKDVFTKNQFPFPETDVKLLDGP